MKRLLIAVFLVAALCVPAEAAPDTFALASPADGLCTSAVSFVFSWDTAASPDTQPLAYYNLQIDTTTAFDTALVDSSSVTSPIDSVTLWGTDTYYWRVLAYDTAGEARASSDSRSLKIDTTAPVAAVLGYPANGHDTSATVIRFTWTAASDTHSGIAYQRLQVATVDSFTSCLIDSNVGTAAADTRTIAANDTYYWRIVAYDTAGNSTAATASRFLIDTTGPSITLLAPANATETRALSILFSWSAADSLSSVASYRVQVDTLGTFAYPYRDSALTDTTFAVLTILTETSYWRVSATDSLGNTCTTAARVICYHTGPQWFVASDTGSDTLGTGSAARPFRTIACAIGVAAAGDTIRIYRGTYAEGIAITKDTLAIIGSGDSTIIVAGSTTHSCSAVNRVGLIVRSLTCSGAASSTHDGFYWSGVKGSEIGYVNVTGRNNGVRLSNCTTVLLRYSTIYSNSGCGVAVDTGRAVTIYYNVIYSNSGQGLRQRIGAGDTTCTSLVWNNTFAYDSVAIFIVGATDSMQILNNICYIDSGSWMAPEIFIDTSASHFGMRCDYNVFYQEPYIFATGTEAAMTRRTFSNWKSVTGYDANSNTRRPEFVAP